MTRCFKNELEAANIKNIDSIVLRLTRQRLTLCVTPAAVLNGYVYIFLSDIIFVC